MRVHQISVSPMGANGINNGGSNVSNDVSSNKHVNCNNSAFSEGSNYVPSVISCSTNGNGGSGFGSRASSVSSNSCDICRICHCEGDAECPLFSPCYCSGSLRYVHQGCLQQWIKSSNIRSCELCKFQFIMQTKTKPFSEWEHLEMSGFERRRLFCAVSFHLVALACVIWSLYILIVRTADDIQSNQLGWSFWIKSFVVAIGFSGGVIFMFIQCKAYLQIFQRWRAFNRVIFVQNAPEKPHLGGKQSPCRCDDKYAKKNIPTVHESVVNMANSGGEKYHQYGEPSSSEFKSYQDSVRENKYEDSPSFNRDDETSIDLKGVRNVHIIINEENRIHLQKDQSPSCKIDCITDNDVNKNENSIITSNAQSHPMDRWHIKIGKTLSSDRTDNNERGITNNLPESNSSQEENAASSNLESPVLKLQINKAEIVIQFGQKSTASTSDNGNVSNLAVTNNEPSNKVVIKDTVLNIDAKKESVDNIGSDVKVKEIEPGDNKETEDSSVDQIGFCYDEDTNDRPSDNMITDNDSVKLLSKSLSDHGFISRSPKKSHSSSNFCKENNEADKLCVSEPGSGSQSPLLAKKEYYD